MSEYYKENELYHHGILGMKWGVRRYQPYQSGKRVNGGKEVGEAAKAAARAEKREKRKEGFKRGAKAAAKFAGRAALTGATVAAKVVFSSAITSATLVGIAAAGYRVVTSEPFQSVMQKTALKAGTWLADKYINVGVSMVDDDYDYYLAQGLTYLNSL